MQMLVAPDRLPTAGEAGPEQVPGFEMRPPFPLAGVVGVVVLCLVSAGLWTALIWTLVAVLG
jgi:hypothetical protein